MKCKCLLHCFECVQLETVAAALVIIHAFSDVQETSNFIFGHAENDTWIIIFMGVRKVLLLWWLSKDSIMKCRKCKLHVYRFRTYFFRKCKFLCVNSMVCVPHSYVLQSSAIYITFKQKYAYRIDIESKYLIKLIFHYLNQNSMAETMKDRN